MKKIVCLLLALVLVMGLAACGGSKKEESAAPAAESAPAAEAEGPDYSGYTIRIYSNSNSTERVTWLVGHQRDLLR